MAPLDRTEKGTQIMKQKPDYYYIKTFGMPEECKERWGAKAGIAFWLTFLLIVLFFPLVFPLR